jgi:hypothetical protein
LLHENVQALLTQPAVAFAMLVEHTLPHVLQSLGLLVVSTHVVPQSVGVADAQPETQVEPEHTGAAPVHA